MAVMFPDPNQVRVVDRCPICRDPAFESRHRSQTMKGWMLFTDDAGEHQHDPNDHEWVHRCPNDHEWSTRVKYACPVCPWPLAPGRTETPSPTVSLAEPQNIPVRVYRDVIVGTHKGFEMKTSGDAEMLRRYLSRQFPDLASVLAVDTPWRATIVLPEMAEALNPPWGGEPLAPPPTLPTPIFKTRQQRRAHMRAIRGGKG